MCVYFLLLEVVIATELSLPIQINALNHCCIEMPSPQHIGIPCLLKCLTQGNNAKAQAVQLRLSSCLSNSRKDFKWQMQAAPITLSAVINSFPFLHFREDART